MPCFIDWIFILVELQYTLGFHYSNDYLIHLYHLKIINEEVKVTQQFSLHYKYPKHFFHLCLFADFTFHFYE